MQKITPRNIIYSALALALVSSYFYVQSQPQFDPLVASDSEYSTQSAPDRNASEDKTVSESN